MMTLEYVTDLDAPRQEVFARLERPGALTRLWPPFGGTVQREPDRGLDPGSTSTMRLAPPGPLGATLTAVDSALPFPLPLPRWLAEHTYKDQGRSFTDVMSRGPLTRWEHTHTLTDQGTLTGSGSGTRMLDHIELELPRGTAAAAPLLRAGIDRTFAYRGRQLRDDLRLAARLSAPPLTVAVTGASGLVGRQVCAMLSGLGCTVRRLVRREARGADEISWNPATGELDPSALADCDAVVHLAGAPIGGRFTEERKRAIMDSRVDGTTLVARTLAGLAADGKRRTLVSASAIGYYGARPGADPLDEDSAPGDDFLARVCRAWEAACAPAEEAGVRVVRVRTGLVLTPQGGLLTRFLPLFSAGVGGPLGSEAVQSWIGIDDLVEIYACAVMDARWHGPVNAVAPHPVTAREFARTLGAVMHRPAVLPVPGWAPRLLLGAEGSRELAEADQHVLPMALASWGHPFRHPDLRGQLAHVLGTAARGTRLRPSGRP